MKVSLSGFNLWFMGISKQSVRSKTVLAITIDREEHITAAGHILLCTGTSAVEAAVAHERRGL